MASCQSVVIPARMGQCGQVFEWGDGSGSQRVLCGNSWVCPVCALMARPDDGERLAGVIDWEDAALGDPLADVANARLEILWAFGPEAMADFTQHYQSLTGQDFNGLPYWDLCAAIRPAGKLGNWGLAPDVMQNMIQRHQHFVEQALKDMSA